MLTRRRFIASTAAAGAVAAQGAAVRYGSEACGAGGAHHFVLDAGVGGWLDRPPADPATRVTGLWAGSDSRC